MSDDPVAFAEGVQHERARILAATKVRCGRQLRDDRRLCGLNLGHIGSCSAMPLTISITRTRLEEILNG